MPRKRMVSPELLTSESVAALPVAARYGFVGLWMYLDDEGRGKDNAALLRAHLWPLDESYTARKVAADIVRWAEKRLICRYRVEDNSFLHVPTWKTWQTINRPTPTRFPPCPVDLSGHDHDILPAECRDSHGVLREEYVRDPGGFTRNVVEVSSSQRSSSDDAADPTPPGSASIAEIKARLGRPDAAAHKASEAS